MSPCLPPRTGRAPWLALLAAATLLGTGGCTMPCSKVQAEADRRYDSLADELRRDRDPGGEGYDLTLTVPSALVDESFQRMMEAGEIPTSHDLTTDLGLAGLTNGLEVRFQADLRGASFVAVEGDPARLEAHLELRLRGTGDRELFDVDATVDGPVELEVRTAKGGTPALYVELGDLRDSRVELSGEVLGQAFVTALEGLIPAGGLKELLGAIGVDAGGLAAPLEQAARDAVDQQLAAVVQTLVEDSIGDVKVMELGRLQLGALELTPQAAGLRSGKGWIGVGLRTDLDTGAGALALTPPIARGRSTLQLRISEAFLNQAIRLAYVDGLIPRTLDDAGAPADAGPYRLEPLDVQLDDDPRLGVRVYRCDDPCGWADLRATLATDADGRDELALTASDIQVESAKGAGKLVDLILAHQERVMGEPIEFTQSVSRVLQPQVAGAPLNLRVSRLVMGDGRLAATLTYELGEVERGGRQPPAGGGEGSKKGTGSKKGSGSKKDGGSKKGSGGRGERR
jgi:hypothetical protein